MEYFAVSDNKKTKKQLIEQIESLRASLKSAHELNLSYQATSRKHQNSEANIKAELDTWINLYEGAVTFQANVMNRLFKGPVK
jgi:hypothetical protein